jgi:hypothetical protein
MFVHIREAINTYRISPSFNAFQSGLGVKGKVKKDKKLFDSTIVSKRAKC